MSSIFLERWIGELVLVVVHFEVVVVAVLMGGCGGGCT